jgi:hypothetical protein
VRPDVSKIALALKAQRPQLGAMVQRAVAACDSLRQSMWACTRTLSIRLCAVITTLLRAFRRELQDLKKQAPGREPGWMGAWEAYSRLVCSSVCEAFLELRPARSMARQESEILLRQGEMGSTGMFVGSMPKDHAPEIPALARHTSEPLSPRLGRLGFSSGSPPRLRRPLANPESPAKSCEL